MNSPTYTIPTTVSEAQTLLRVLELPILTPELLRTIGAKEGAQFKQALAEAASKPPNAEAHLRYLKAVITACAPLTRAAIIALGFEPPPLEVIIDLSKREGTVFASSVRSLKYSDADPASLNAAKEYLRKALQSVCDGPASGIVGNTSANPHPASAAQPAPAQPSARREAPSPSVTPTSPSAANNVARLPERREQSRSTPPPTGFGGRDEAPAQAATETEGRKFVSHHLYGGKAAMCFSIDETRKGTFPTVRVEAAPAKGEKSYDWDKKVPFQLTVAELPLVFGVLFGFTQKIELSGHGESNEKGLTIEDQGAKFFMAMRVRGGGAYAIPVLPKDTFSIMTMIFAQMKANSPHLSDNQIMIIAKRVCEKQAPVQAPPRAANG